MKFLSQAKTKISNNIVCEWVKMKARKGKIGARQPWENFQKNFTIPIFSTTKSVEQSCVITTRAGLEEEKGGEKNFPETAIVWNGTGYGRDGAPPATSSKI